MTAPALQRVALNFWTLTVSRVLYRAVSVGVAMYLARELGAAVLGHYATVMNVLTLYLAFADLGVTNLVIRDVARDRALASSYLDNFFVLQLLVGMLLIVLIMGTGWVSGYSELLLLALAVGSAGPLFSGLSNAYQALMNAHDLFYPFAIIEILCMLVFLLGNVIVVFAGGGLLALVAVTSVVSLVKYVIGAFWARKLDMRVGWHLDATLVGRMVLTGLPFLMINGTHFAIQRLDVLMLSWITTDERVGIYSAASRLIFASLFLASSIGAMLYPVLSRVVAEEGARAKELYRDGTVYVYALGCLTALLFWQLAPWLVALLYGTGFEESAPLLQTLGLFLPLFSLGLVASNVLMVSRAVWYAVWASILALLAGVLLSPWTIALWGLQGAALGVLVAEAVAAALYTLFAFTRLGMVFPARRVLTATLACVLPPALLSLTGSATGLWQGAAGAALALALMLLFGTVTVTELRGLLRLALPRRTGA